MDNEQVLKAKELVEEAQQAINAINAEIDVANQELNVTNQELQKAEKAKHSITAQVTDAHDAILGKSKEIEQLKSHINEWENYKNALGLFKRKEKKELEEEKIPELKRQLEPMNLDFEELKNKHEVLQQQDKEAEKKVADLKQRIENQKQSAEKLKEKLKKAKKEKQLADMEARAEGGDEKEQYNFVMHYVKEGNEAKVRELVKKDGAGYAQAKAELDEKERVRKAKAEAEERAKLAKEQEERDLKEIRDAANELISWCNTYSYVANFGGIDENINIAKTALLKSEEAYRGATTPEEKKKVMEVISGQIPSLKSATAQIKIAYEKAEEIARLEKLRQEMQQSLNRMRR
jgi:chromosome segregation ATPase